MRDGKLFLNGTVVDWFPRRNTKLETPNRNHSKKAFRISFKQRMAIYDAITYQNYQASQQNNLYHTFLTLTFPKDNVPYRPNDCVTQFFKQIKRKGFVNYCWTREIGEAGGLVHYHFTTVGKYTPIATLNQVWGKCRGHEAPNALRSSINPLTGKAQMVIHNLHAARAYVAKYMTKDYHGKCVTPSAEFVTQPPGRVWARSHDLNFPPVSLPDATGLARHEYYGSGRVFESDFARVGSVKSKHAYYLYSGMRTDWNQTLETFEKESPSKPETTQTRLDI